MPNQFLKTPKPAKAIGFPLVENLAFPMAEKQSQLYMGRYKHPAEKKYWAETPEAPCMEHSSTRNSTSPKIS